MRANLPNPPTPDYIIPAGLLRSFFSLDGDTVVYELWDPVTFGAGNLPTDGMTAYKVRSRGTGLNTATNAAGEVAIVDASPLPDIPAASSWAVAIMGIMITIVATLLMARRRLVAV